jgi:TatD DNase family protein
MIIDTHVHLDDDRYNDDLEFVLNNAIAHDVKQFIIPGADPKSLEKAIALSEKHEEIYFSVGVHPYDADNYDEAYLEQFIKHEKCVAVGECGLDYFRLPDVLEEIAPYKAEQKEVFEAQIKLAIKYKLPLIVHVRDANQDSFDLLKKHEDALVGGVLHCYNASPLLLELSEKFYYGIGGVLTFKNAKNLVEILPQIPQNRLLIETDAPYLTPTPHRGKRNEPAYTTFVAEKISEVLNIPNEELQNLTTKNCYTIFSKLLVAS